MNIPNLPISKLVDENGSASAVELQFRQQLVQALQYHISQNGLVPPLLTTTQIADVAAKMNGLEYVVQQNALFADSTTNELKVIQYVAGVPTVKVVQVV